MISLLRLSGWAAIAAAIVHLIQFLVLGIGPALAEPDYPTPAESGANYWFGLTGSITFTLIGLSYLVFFSGATELVWRGATGTAVVWRRAAQSAAVIGIAAWFIGGMLNIARRGFNATGIAEAAGGDDAIARAALQSSYVVLTAATVAEAVVFCAWWIAFAVEGIRTRTIGWATAIVVVVLGGLIPLSTWLANIGGIPTIVLAFLVLGPVLLVKARRLRRSEAAAPADLVAQ